MSVEIHPLTPDRWPDFEQLFGPRGAFGGCWCMWWRQSRADFDRLKGEQNRALFKEIVDRGEVPGLLAYVDGKPAGWVAVAPRANYPTMLKTRVIAPVDDEPVWSVSCFFIGKAYRRQGLTVALLKGAVQFVAERGGKIIEGYPTDAGEKTHGDPYVYMGLASAFIEAGFKEVLRRAEKRPIMRFYVE